MKKNSVTRSIFRHLFITVISLSLIVLPMSSAQAVSLTPEHSWQAIVSDGFGNGNNSFVEALEVFRGKIYAGTQNFVDGTTIWRSADGMAWTQVTAPGFDSAYGANNAVVFDMFVFKDKLFAGTGHWDGAPSAGQIWRSTNGTDWSLVAADGLGNPDNFGFTTFASFKGMLYVAALNRIDGIEIWRSKTGDNGSWEQVAAQGLGGGAPYFVVTTLMEFQGQLYAGVEATLGTSAQVWRSSDGVEWTLVSEDGFGDSDNYQTGGSAVHRGQLYMTTRNDITGAQLWRSKNGVTWVQVVGNGFGDANNVKIESLTTYAGDLYAITNNPLDNPVTGAEVWRSNDGVNWTQINEDGFGDSNTFCALWSNGTVVFQGSYLTGCTGPNGGTIWKLQR